MNKVFKVVFNAVRNKMMVVNEMTSSMQVGRKKAQVAVVVGATLLMLGGGTSAEEIKTIPVADSINWKKNDSIVNLYDFVGTGTGSNNVFSYSPTEEVKPDSRPEFKFSSFNAGFSSSENVINNSITISGGTFSSVFIYGGYGLNTVNVGFDSDNKNQVLITGGNFDYVRAYGGYARDSGAAQFNTVRIGNDNATTNPEGNFSLVVGGRSDGDSAKNNSVEILAPNIKVMGNSVIGGDSLKLSENNEVTIKGGQFILQNGVFGGWCKDGDASNNVVTITGGTSIVRTVEGIVGGFSSSSSAIRNVVTITGSTSIVGTFEGISLPTNIVGGLIGNDTGSAKGNTVNIGGVEEGCKNGILILN